MSLHAAVVIVDDEPDVRLLLKLQLPDYGCVVVAEAADGQQALDACIEHRPDVVILDLLMPGVNGFQAIPMLQEHCPDVRIIAYSAVAGDFVRDEMDRLGITLRLKSGDPVPLVEAIAELTGQPLP